MSALGGRRIVVVIAALAALGAIGWGGTAWYASFTRVATDDAYVEGSITPVSAKVGGHIVEMLVRDNQSVKKGDLLLCVVTRDYQARHEQEGGADGEARVKLRTSC